MKTLIGHPIFEMIMKKIDLVEETILKEEIAWFLGNIISLFDFELTFKVINFDVLNFLMKLLNSNLSFPSLVISLRDIHNIFVTEILFKTKQENNSDSNIDSINYLEYFVKHGGEDILSFYKNVDRKEIIEEIEKIEKIILNKFL